MQLFQVFYTCDSNVSVNVPAATMPTDDKALIEAFQQGDDFAFVSLYNRYKGPVYTFCLKMLFDREQAQDVMQETFLRIYENRDRLLNANSFKAWTFTIARNQCLNQFRRSSKHVLLDEEHTLTVSETAVLAQVAMLEKSEQVELVNHFLGRLKPEYREVLILREYQNLTYEEIAAVTRSTLSAVKSRLFKARRKLADFMLPVLNRERQRAVNTQLN